MPKQKTHSATKKRFRVTGAGKLMRRRRMRTTPPGHLVKSKSGKRRRVRQARSVAPSDHKKIKKLTFRRLWIMRINAAARKEGLSYNQLVAGLRKAEIPLDRLVLPDLAVSDPEAFGKIAEQAKAALQS